MRDTLKGEGVDEVTHKPFLHFETLFLMFGGNNLCLTVCLCLIKYFFSFFQRAVKCKFCINVSDQIERIVTWGGEV
jgi:hypothetical protein